MAVGEPLPPGRARSEAAFARFMQDAASAPDLNTAWRNLQAPDCKIHLENGDTGTIADAREHAQSIRAVFPDLEISIDRALFPADRVVMQLSLVATVRAGIPVLPAGERMYVRCAMVGRPREDLRMGEIWRYLNPGFPLTFPPRGLRATPPPPDGAGDAEAAALYEAWREAARREGGDVVSALTSVFAPDGVVHLGNGDDGDAEAVLDLFRYIRTGLPDLSVEVDEVLIGDGHLFARLRLRGTHTHALGPNPATGRVLPSSGLAIVRPDRSGRAAESWLYVAPVIALSVPPRG